jgi:hypothetical protein
MFPTATQATPTTNDPSVPTLTVDIAVVAPYMRVGEKAVRVITFDARNARRRERTV